MGWFNYYGLIAIVIILIPNILCAVLNKSEFENRCKNKAIIALEQIGRYGCMIFMVFNIPYTYFGFWFGHALTVYLIGGGVLLALYCLGWIIFRKGGGLIKALWLSVTPTVLFIFCGVMVTSIPLMLCAVLFGAGHITISLKNIEN